MNLTISDVNKIAKLARIAVSEQESQAVLPQLNKILDLVEVMQSVDTRNIQAMANVHDNYQYLRQDQVTVYDVKEELLANAPEQEDGLFLVPKVIE